MMSKDRSCGSLVETICKSKIQREHSLTWNREGTSLQERWKWNETIGPVENRPGRQGRRDDAVAVQYANRLGTWGYPNTDGLGKTPSLQ